MSENEQGNSTQKRFSSDGNSGAEYKVWKRWARAALFVKKVGGTLPEALGLWIYTLLDGQPASALESIDIDKVAAGPCGRSHGGSVWVENHEERYNGGFHWTVETGVYPSSVGRCELVVGSPNVDCLAWMSTWEPGSSNDHVHNPQKLCVRRCVHGDPHIISSVSARSVVSWDLWCGLGRSRTKPKVTMSSGMTWDLSPKSRP